MRLDSGRQQPRLHQLPGVNARGPKPKPTAARLPQSVLPRRTRGQALPHVLAPLPKTRKKHQASPSPRNPCHGRLRLGRNLSAPTVRGRACLTPLCRWPRVIFLLRALLCLGLMRRLFPRVHSHLTGVAQVTTSAKTRLTAGRRANALPGPVKA
jgi:hypothetical protein